MFLLDTNIVSELRKSRPHGAVKAWVAQLDEKQIAIAAMTLGEIQAGIEKTRETDAVKAAELTLWADAMASAANVVAADAAIFRLHARLMHGQPLDHWEDALIAATAMTGGFTLATRNTKDFTRYDVALINPFTFKG